MMDTVKNTNNQKNSKIRFITEKGRFEKSDSPQKELEISDNTQKELEIK